MNVKQLRYVCSIVELGSFSAAAASQGVSVQAVSKSMAELESKLGAPLFERLSGGVRPTPFCRALAGRARRVLDEWDDLERFARSGVRVASLDEPFRMGFCCLEYAGVDRLVSLISAVSSKVIGRRVTVPFVPCDTALDELRAGRVDALITLGPLEADDVTCGSLGGMSSAALLPPGHPLAGRPEVTIDELGDYPVLDPVRFEHFSRAVVGAYAALGLRSERVRVCGHDEAVALMRRGGYSFIVAGNITGAEADGVIRPIVDAAVIPICLTTLRDSSAIDYVGFRRALVRLGLFS
ncbi:LysR family transcriptional regulator [Thermophilibacter sp.]